jgi:hypothetical protein
VKFKERVWKLEEWNAKRVHNEAGGTIRMCCEVLHRIKIEMLNSYADVSEDACPLRLLNPVEFVQK